jgi:hypothetical protein
MGKKQKPVQTKKSKHNGNRTKKITSNEVKLKKKRKVVKDIIDENIVEISDEDIDEIDNFDSENDQIEEINDDNEEPENDIIGTKRRKKTADKSLIHLKAKIMKWLDNDDKIKDLNQKMKKYKEAKKEHEDLIIKMITKMGAEDEKFDVEDNNKQLRGRVYRHKSVTKGAIKEDIIKKALMEAIRDEKKVDQLVKKIESKRPITERYYLKRTKGNKDD